MYIPWRLINFMTKWTGIVFAFDYAWELCQRGWKYLRRKTNE